MSGIVIRFDDVALRECPQCGHDAFRKVTEILSAEFPVSRLTASAGVPGRQCTRCKETFVAGSVTRQFELAVALELAKYGVHTGEAFRHMRKALGLRAADLAKLLDVTPETISHWETAKARVNRAALVTLGAMIEDATQGRTATRDKLAALGKERSHPKVLTPKLSISEAGLASARSRRST